MVQQRPELTREILWELYYLTREVRHLAALTGLELIGIDDVDALAPLLAPYLRQSPRDVWLRRAHGIIKLRQGNPREALPYLEDVTLLDGDLPGRFALAECHIALSHHVDLDAILGSLPLEPKDQARRWALMAQVEETFGHAPRSLADWRRAVVAEPENRANQYRLGQALVRSGEKEAAEVHLQRPATIGRRQRHLKMILSQIGPQHENDAVMYEAIAKLCLESRLLAEARAWYQETIRIDPTRITAQSALAQMPGPDSGGPLLKALPPRPMSTTTAMTSHVASLNRPGPRFNDVAGSAGLAYQYVNGATDDLFIVDTMGGGIGLIDYDNDGWLDIYLVNGCALPVGSQNPPGPNKLYHNLRDGTFEDVTNRAGVCGRGYGMGCAVGDFDDDGYDDIFITGFQNTLLYRNRGDGTFEDVTKRAGVHSFRWCTAAGFADLDGDRDLDLVVVAYVDADPVHPIPCNDVSRRRIHCTPGYYHAQSNHLFRNNGDGTFTDVSREAGLTIVDAPGLGLAIADLDQDGRLDLFVANDAAPNTLFRNLGGLRFEETAVVAGLAYNGEGHATASMGVVADDLDGDGLIDIFHTNLINEASTLARNLGGGRFADVTEQAGLLVPSRSVTGFGTVALDADNDGRLDLFAANGHVDDAPWQNRPMAEMPHFYQSISRPDGLSEVPPKSWGLILRGLLWVAVPPSETSTMTDGSTLWLYTAIGQLHCFATSPMPVTRSACGSVARPRHPCRSGARVTCRVENRTMVRWVTSGTGYLSAHDSRVWFGLGTSTSIDLLEVRWPSGLEQRWSNLDGDQVIEIREGQKPVMNMSLRRR